MTFSVKQKIVSQCSRETSHTFHRPPPNTRSGDFYAVKKSNSLQQLTDFCCTVCSTLDNFYYTGLLDWHFSVPCDSIGNRATNVHTPHTQGQPTRYNTKSLFRRIFYSVKFTISGGLFRDCTALRSILFDII